MENDMQSARGFTLIEMAVVLLIIGLLLAGMLMPLSTQVDDRKMKETQKALEETKEALIGFAISHSAVDGHPFLPCPDTDNNGLENRLGSTCASQEGNLPWVTLGTAETDSWGNRFHYRVTTAFSNSAAGFTLAALGDIRVCDAAACATIIATAAPAVVLSYGKNGYGAVNAGGGTNPAPTTADELENTDSDTNFVSRPMTDPSAAAGEFDDIVTWLSPNILFNRMVAAGRLP